jgi:hypothetical protein
VIKQISRFGVVVERDADTALIADPFQNRIRLAAPPAA